MRVVTVMWLVCAALCGLAGSGAAVLARGQSAPPAVQPQGAPAQPAPATPVQPATGNPAPPAAAGRNTVPAGIRAAEKRRRSYASCNRESHNRGLRGGARRRFLIRCRLGYERRRPGQGVAQSAPPQPPQPPAKAAPAQPLQPAKRP